MADNSLKRLRMRQMGLKGNDLPDKLTKLDSSKWADIVISISPDEIYVSRHFMVQVYKQNNPDYAGLIRLSVTRTKANQNGWLENITWDELQGIKKELGYGERYAIEIYPRDSDVINVANMRHLWLLAEPLSIGWTK